MSRELNVRVRIAPEAKAEFAECALWYDKRREGLGDEFVHEVHGALRRIADNPGLFGAYEGSGTSKPYQRALVKRFPYVVIFEVTSDEIVVQSICNGARQPGYWERR